MKTTTKTSIDSKMGAIFNEKQIQAIKEVVRKNFWGDCNMNFNTDNNSPYAYGYITNMKGKGKEWSGLWSGIAKIIDKQKPDFIQHISDWWQDGSGDVMFLNIDLFTKQEIKEWVKETNNTPKGQNTKGEWYCGSEFNKVFSSADNSFCVRIECDDIKEVKANTKLIASAPELLEALKKIKTALDVSTEVDRKYWSKQIDIAIKKATE